MADERCSSNDPLQRMTGSRATSACVHPLDVRFGTSTADIFTAVRNVRVDTTVNQLESGKCRNHSPR
jgi:hypothetical protein